MSFLKIECQYQSDQSMFQFVNVIIVYAQRIRVCLGKNWQIYKMDKKIKSSLFK